MTLRHLQHFLLCCFAFFGPLGALLTPPFVPNAFRFYHFFLPFFPLFFIRRGAWEWRIVLLFVPFLLYALISAYFTQNGSFEVDSYPLLRAFLLIAQSLFVLGGAFSLHKSLKKLMKFYLAGFFVSLLVGYIFFIGYAAEFLSLETIERYCVEAQIGWGLLRFSPGTYPNEYGNIASFVLSLLLLRYGERRGFWRGLFALLTFVAFLLTTTRAAYLSFSVAFLYLLAVAPQVRKVLWKLGLCGLAILFLLKSVSLNFFSIIARGVGAISWTKGSTGVRFAEWVKGFEKLDRAPFFGEGFSASIYTHNVYLELLFELGIVGVLLLTLTLFSYIGIHSRSLSLFFSRENRGEERHIVAIGLIHVFLFALTNHNMHHHLTWLTFLLFSSSLYRLSPLPPEPAALQAKAQREAP